MRALIWAYGFLITAIAAEVIGTTLLAKSAQFTRLWPSIGMLAAYGVSFYLLTLVLKTIPLGVAYAIWGGLGIVATTLIGMFAVVLCIIEWIRQARLGKAAGVVAPEAAVAPAE